MTQQGEELYGHAMSILKHSNVIRSMSERPNGRRFSVSGYRSGLLTKLMVQLYQNCGEQLKYEYREGTVEEITDNVASRISELGIVYFAEAQMPCFQHIMWHEKNWNFTSWRSAGSVFMLGKIIRCTTGNPFAFLN